MSRAKSAGPYVQNFIVDGVWLGESLRSVELVNDQRQAPRSLGMVCPHCAEIWARCPVSLPGGKPNPFQFWTIACRKCPTPSDRGRGIYGSLLLDWEAEFVASWPDAVWQRELQHHLSLYKE